MYAIMRAFVRPTEFNQDGNIVAGSIDGIVAMIVERTDEGYHVLNVTEIEPSMIIPDPSSQDLSLRHKGFETLTVFADDSLIAMLDVDAFFRSEKLETVTSLLSVLFPRTMNRTKPA